MIGDLQIGELLVSRMSHDLAGVLGAISNGTEFLTENNLEFQQQAKELVSHSAEEAIARLQFFRQAYGFLSMQHSLELGNIREIITKFLANTKISLKWPQDEHVTLSAREAKIICNLIMVSQNIVVYGGDIVVSVQQNPRTIFLSSSSTNQIKTDEDGFQILRGNFRAIEFSSKNINYLYLYKMIKEAGAQLTINHQSKRIDFKIEFN